MSDRTNSSQAAVLAVGDVALRKLFMAVCCLEFNGCFLLFIVVLLLLVLLGVLLLLGVRKEELERGVDNSETCV